MRDRHFTNISVEIWVQPLNVNGFLGLLVTWEGSLSIILKLEIEGNGW